MIQSLTFFLQILYRLDRSCVAGVMRHGADIMIVKKPWHRHNASKYWPSVSLRGCQTVGHCGLRLGTLHGETIGQHQVTSCDILWRRPSLSRCHLTVKRNPWHYRSLSPSWEMPPHCCIPGLLQVHLQCCRVSPACAGRGPCPSYSWGSPHP